MQRKLTLSRNAFLWEKGDPARNIGVVERGKLAIRSESGMLGIVLPRMVVGEGAIQNGWAADAPSNGHRRSASVVAIEDDTVVAEWLEN